MTRVGVIGAYGRMGELICKAIENEPEIELVAKVGASDPLKMLGESGVEIAVDVTNAQAAEQNLPWLALHEIHAVVGTSGISNDKLDELNHEFVAADKTCFVVPNFSIGAILMMRFAEQAAYYFDDVEIIELHRESKKDAPSGTARHTAERIAGGRSKPWTPDATEVEDPKGVRGGLVEGVPVHSVRLRGMLAHQEVLFGSAGEVLTIRHDSLDRIAFMPGVIRAIKGVPELPPGVTVGLDHVLSGD